MALFHKRLSMKLLEITLYAGEAQDYPIYSLRMTIFFFVKLLVMNAIKSWSCCPLIRKFQAKRLIERKQMSFLVSSPRQPCDK